MSDDELITYRTDSFNKIAYCKEHGQIFRSPSSQIVADMVEHHLEWRHGHV